MARALRSFSGWHRSECEWLALSPKFNFKRHRWRDAFRVGGVLFVVFVSATFFGSKNASQWFVSSTKKIAVNVSLLLRYLVDCGGFPSLIREIYKMYGVFPAANVYTRNNVSCAQKKRRMIYFYSNNQQKHTKKKARRGSSREIMKYRQPKHTAYHSGRKCTDRRGISMNTKHSLYFRPQQWYT